MNRTLAGLFIALLIVLFAAPMVDAHPQGPLENSVNQNKEILIYEETTFDGALDYSIQAWNDLNAANGYQGVTLRRAGTLGEATLHVYDVNSIDGGTAGTYTVYSPGMDIIELDKNQLSNHGSNYKHRLIMHELGHALGFAHNDLIDTSIMYPCPTCTTLLTPGPHDQSDYYGAWVLNQFTPAA